MRSCRALVHGALALVLCGLAQPSPASSTQPAAGVVTRAAAPKPVAKLKVGLVTGTTVSLSWRNPSGAAFTGTMVRLARGATAPQTVKAGRLVKRLPKGVHALTVTGLSRSTTYSFSVFALYRKGAHARPAKVTVKTGNRILNGVRSVITNSNEACAIFANRRVDCWGFNVNDNLGSGVTTGFVTVPVHVKGVGGSGLLTGVRSLTTDGGGFCALMANATVDCWGDNGDGDLGQGNTSRFRYPVVVKGVGARGLLSGITQVVGGAFGYCARLSSAGVACWGNNQYGALGSGSAAFTSSSVVRVVGTDGTGTLDGVRSLTKVGYTTCAVMASSNGLDCWGGQNPQTLGAPTNHPDNVPFRVPGVGGSGFLTGVEAVSIHGSNMCAVLGTGGLDCWGINLYGVLGTGPSGLSSTTPVPVLGVGGTGTLGGVAEVVGDGRFMCARLTGGGVACWGLDARGELGGGGAPTGTSTVPRAVVGVGGVGTLSGARQLALDFESVCAVLTSNGVVCWGNNSLGELGNGTNTGPDSCGPCNSTPGTPKGMGGKGVLGGTAQLIPDEVNATGGAGYYAVTTTGGVDFWGAGTNAQGLFGVYAFQDVAKYATPAAE